MSNPTIETFVPRDYGSSENRVTATVFDEKNGSSVTRCLKDGLSVADTVATFDETKFIRLRMVFKSVLQPDGKYRVVMKRGLRSYEHKDLGIISLEEFVLNECSAKRPAHYCLLPVENFKEMKASGALVYDIALYDDKRKRFTTLKNQIVLTKGQVAPTLVKLANILLEKYMGFNHVHPSF